MGSKKTRRIVCCCCGKQIVDFNIPQSDKYCAPLYGAKAGFKEDEGFCGYCAALLDENGLFPEERISEGLDPI